MDTSPESNISLEAGVGPVLEKYPQVERIAVLRGGGLGDLIYTYPALSALKAAYPGAHVTLLGTPIHKALAASTEGPVDDVVILPFAKGVRDGDEDPEALAAFLKDMQARKFDLAIQMHGGGRYSNPFLLKLGARHTVGTRTPDAEHLERNLDYIYYQNEPDRWFETVGLAGAPTIIPPLLRPKAEYVEAVAGLKDPQRSSVVVIHPGATDPRRRWPASCFADAAAGLAAEGAQVLVVGDNSEKALAQEVAELARDRVPEGGPGSCPVGGRRTGARRTGGAA
ncbi:glycosyltransferase family 9 protein [Paenarthrobacter sp. S56]|uniref:glycosyltransferase family 9 protein n=1 Tax=Paenarthrobacter sp. S56 TaxID=3138179 RepID=UPI00321BD411